jgi:hypothetical protein
VPIREDSPAARITPAKLGDRDMLRKIAESAKKVSELETDSLLTVDFDGFNEDRIRPVTFLDSFFDDQQ